MFFSVHSHRARAAILPSLGYQLMVHFHGNAATIASAVRGQIHDLDSAMAIYNAETMEEHLRQALFLPRLAGALFGIFGFVGLALAAIGLYGVISYSVSRRTREIGIRIALGAQLSAVRRLILRQGMVLTSSRWRSACRSPSCWRELLSSFLYGIRPHDTMTFTLVPLFLAAVALRCLLDSSSARNQDRSAERIAIRVVFEPYPVSD